AGDDQRLGPLAHLREGVPDVALVLLDEVHAILPRAATSASRCTGVWVAISEMRSRLVPGGTVGGRIPCANSPSASSRSQTSIVRRASPSWRGRMCERGWPARGTKSTL